MKVKIVNRKKFFKNTGILIGIIIFILLICMDNTVFSHKATKYKTKYVTNGETLWKIAKQEQKYNEYYNNKDIRDIIQSIKNINNLSNDEIFVNQSIIIPIL